MQMNGPNQTRLNWQELLDTAATIVESYDVRDIAAALLPAGRRRAAPKHPERLQGALPVHGRGAQGGNLHSADGPDANHSPISDIRRS